MSLLIKAGSGVGFSFGVRAWTEMEIQCVKGMYRLKVVSSEKGLVSFRVLTSIHSDSMSTTSSVFLVLEKHFSQVRSSDSHTPRYLKWCTCSNLSPCRKMRGHWRSWLHVYCASTAWNWKNSLVVTGNRHMTGISPSFKPWLLLAIVWMQ